MVARVYDSLFFEDIVEQLDNDGEVLALIVGREDDRVFVLRHVDCECGWRQHQRSVLYLATRRKGGCSRANARDTCCTRIDLKSLLELEVLAGASKLSWVHATTIIRGSLRSYENRLPSLLHANKQRSAFVLWSCIFRAPNPRHQSHEIVYSTNVLEGILLNMSSKHNVRKSIGRGMKLLTC